MLTCSYLWHLCPRQINWYSRHTPYADRLRLVPDIICVLGCSWWRILWKSWKAIVIQRVLLSDCTLYEVHQTHFYWHRLCSIMHFPAGQRTSRRVGRYPGACRALTARFSFITTRGLDSAVDIRWSIQSFCFKPAETVLGTHTVVKCCRGTRMYITVCSKDHHFKSLKYYTF